MRLSTKSEYACLALLELSGHYGKGMLKIENISESKNIPKKFLENILLVLNRAGYLKSKRGPEGGYYLAKKPSEITLADIIRQMDGPLAPVESVSKYFYSETPIQQSEELIKVFREIRDFVANKLESTTFADLIKKR